MNGLILGLIVGIISLGLLFFFSVVDIAISRLSRLSLRVLAERESHPKFQLLHKIASDRNHCLLPLELGCQMLLVTLAVLFTIFFTNTFVFIFSKPCKIFPPLRYRYKNFMNFFMYFIRKFYIWKIAHYMFLFSKR